MNFCELERFAQDGNLSLGRFSRRWAAMRRRTADMHLPAQARAYRSSEWIRPCKKPHGAAAASSNRRSGHNTMVGAKRQGTGGDPDPCNCSSSPRFESRCLDMMLNSMAPIIPKRLAAWQSSLRASPWVFVVRPVPHLRSSSRFSYLAVQRVGCSLDSRPDQQPKQPRSHPLLRWLLASRCC